MGRIYTVANQKGGVGKTTTAISLGAYLANYGQKVLLVDLDPQSNATSCLKIDKHTVRGGTYDVLIGAAPAASFILHNPRLKLSLLPASPALAGAEVELVSELARETRLKKGLEPVVERYDYVIVDCPPSLGLLTLNGLVAAQDGVIVPVQCEYLALEGLTQLNQTLERVREALFPGLTVRGLVLTMYDARTILANDVVEEVRRAFGGKVFNSIIPRSVRLAEAPSYGQPISIYAPASHGAQAYAALAHELLEEDGISIPVPGRQV
ncbi:MAG: ParA family protein [Anaerolineae bacterium]|jgi:chromosome partitioning protein|nr:ParA family protein [Anaerolineae bacterium]MCZ7553646.1 ParA family protein [Anaerolineales bacterium]